MTSDIGNVVRPLNDPIGINQVAISTRKGAVLVAGWPRHQICATDRLIFIAQKLKWKFLGGGECQVRGGGVKRGAKNDRVVIDELLGAVTQAPSLQRSTRRGGLRIPPQQHP